MARSRRKIAAAQNRAIKGCKIDPGLATAPDSRAAFEASALPADQFSADVNDAAIANPERLGRSKREIEYAASNSWPTIRDDDFYTFSRFDVRHTQSRPKRQRPVRSSHSVCSE
jgi:hypothetical protein